MVDRLEVRIHPDVAAMARAAADEAAAVLRAAVADRGVAHAMFATGNSQLAFVDAWSPPPPTCPGRDVVVFHMDEYVGSAPTTRPGSSGGSANGSSSRATPRAAHYVDGLARPGERVRALRRPARRRTRSTCAAWASARTATWPSTTRRSPTSTTRWT